MKNEKFAASQPGRFYVHLGTIGGMAECRFCTSDMFWSGACATFGGDYL